MPDPLDVIRSVVTAYSNPGLVNESRKGALTDVVEGYTVDTVCAYDTGQWETGIEPPNESWVIVEQYDDETAARTGHASWVAKVKSGQRSFSDVNIFHIPGL